MQYYVSRKTEYVNYTDGITGSRQTLNGSGYDLRIVDSDEVFDRVRVGNKVRQLLDGAEIGTQASLARHLGIAPASVNRWVKDNGNPDPKSWKQIERFFDLRPGTLRAIALGADGDTDEGVLVSLLEEALSVLDDDITKGERSGITKTIELLRRNINTQTD